jgi:exonuclease SbcC
MNAVAKEIDDAGEAVFDKARLNEAATAVRNLESQKSELDMIRGRIARMPELVQHIVSLGNESVAAEAELKRVEEERIAVGFDKEMLQSLEKGRAAASLARDIVLAKKHDADSKVKVAEAELRGRKDMLENLSLVESEREKQLDAQHYLQKLLTLFGDFREGMIAQIRPTLAELSSQLYGEVTNGRYALIELDDDYEMRIMDASQYFGIRRFSGGEKDLANLCLRLAISLSISMSAGLERGFIILDEVFGSQDSERKELILKAMANLRHRFPQIFLITHTEEIRNRVEQLIEVRPTRMGYSEVIVNGASAA